MLSLNGRLAAIRDLRVLRISLRNDKQHTLDTIQLMNSAVAYVFRCVSLAGGGDVLAEFNQLHKELLAYEARKEGKEKEGSEVTNNI